MKIAIYAFAFAAAIFLGRFELHTDDTGIEVGLLLLTSFLLGCLHPSHAWQWAVLVGGAIPLADLLMRKPFPPGVAAFTIAVALIGSYLGAGVRWVYAR